jgi:peptide/nickel transport system substrate-binding protein
MLVRLTAATIMAGLAMAAAPEARELRIGLGSEPSSMDPHYQILHPNEMVARHVFEPLIFMDERMRLAPGLATGWRPDGDDAWVFDLREGVRWHDGTPFTADDVVFTIARAPNVPNSPASYSLYTRQITAIDVEGPHRLRFRTNGPAPSHPALMAQLSIIQRKAAEGATTADFNSGRAMVGTGAYRFGSWRSGDRITYTANPDYWGGAQPWTAVTVRPMVNPGARVAALMAGDLDLIDAVPPADRVRLARTPGVRLAETGSNLVMFLNIDHDRDRSPFIFDNEGRPMDRNPLKDLRVRRAISLAINRAALVERVMDGSAVPASQMAPEGFFGFNPDLRPDPFDIEQARRLLAEAGYPNGFRLTIHGPNNRYVNDDKVVQAIAQMLSRIGIQAQVETMPLNVYFTRASRRDFSLFLTGWSATTGDPSVPLSIVIHTFDDTLRLGNANRGRYSNAAVDRVIRTALTTVDEARREALLREASALSIADKAIVPLYVENYVWATRANTRFTPRADGRTNAIYAAPAD